MSINGQYIFSKTLRKRSLVKSSSRSKDNRENNPK
jgi:hypothetical protein